MDRKKKLRVLSDRLNYIKNKEKIRERIYARRQVIRAYVVQEKSHPCKDCGGTFPFCSMDFDHLGDKLMNVSTMVSNGYNLDKIKVEIAKCDLICANCHRIRTFNRKMGDVEY